MLDPRDQSFLSLAVARGVIPEARARELSLRYRGLPGGLAGALVELGVIAAEARLRLEAELASAELRALTGSARRGELPPPPVAITPPLPTDTDADSAPTVFTDEVLRPPDASSVLESEGAAPPQARTGPLLGALLGPRAAVPGYELEGELGRGGMGVVYRARRVATGELVAIKLLLDVSPRHRQRFKREATALQRLEHPHVIGVLETGEAPDGQPYLVMPYVAGGDLRQALARGALDRDQALGVLARVARAIAHAHAAQVVHRDLKPGNVLLDEGLAPRVTDFGLAKILDHDTQLTRTGVALGTPQYMAPEQVRCTNPGPPADVHALGVMLFQMITGELPYPGAGAVLFQQIVNDPAPRAWELRADVPRDVGELALAAMEKDPADRPTALALAEALEAHLAGKPIRIRAASRARRAWRAAAAVVAAALFGGGAGLGLAAAAGRGPPQAEPAQVKAALAALDAALAGAARHRGSGLEALRAEADAHRAAVALVEQARAGPPGLSREVEARYAASGARARRLEVLAALAPALLPGDPAAARLVARERADVEPDATSLVLLARALAALPGAGAEACRLATLAGAASPRGGEPQALAQAAEVLLALHRPALAARALGEGAARSPALAALRARALVAAGDAAAAREALAPLLAAAPRDPALSAAMARVEVALGRPREALAALDAAGAGGDAPSLVARGLALEALHDLPGARRALDEAVRLDPTCAAERGRHHLRRGRAAQALPDLRAVAARDAVARADEALATWLLGGADDVAARRLLEVTSAAAACEASPQVGAAAARWAARVEVTRGRLAAATHAARRAWDLAPDAESAATLAWVLVRAERPAEALEALSRASDRAPEGRVAEALALVALGRPDDAHAAVAALPERLPERADLLRLLALRQARADEVAAAEVAAHALRRAALVPEAGPLPVPVASEPRDLPLRALVDALALEARRARSEPARRALLCARVQALDPEHTPARLELAVADADAPALERLVRAYPHLTDARRARLRVLASKGEVPAADLQGDLPLLHDPEVTPDERLVVAAALVKLDHLEEAARLLEPALKAAPLHLASLRALAKVAAARGDGATAADAERLAAETQAVRAREEAVRRAAIPEITQLVKARDALATWTRHFEHDAEYHLRVAQYENNSARPSRSILAAGEYLRRARAMPSFRVSYWTYAFGYVPMSLEGEGTLELVAREAARRPDDPAPLAARAMFLLARHRSADAVAGDALAAADAALRAVDLDPDAPGLLELAAEASIEAGDAAEAAALLRRALALDPSSGYALFLQARLAALDGDVDLALRLLQACGRPDRAYGEAGYSFAKDPCFARVREHPKLVEFLRQ